MKASKGFLLLDLAVVFLIVGTLLVFVSSAFGGCVKNLDYVRDRQEAHALAESFLLDEAIEAPAKWQVQVLERQVQGMNIKEVQVLETASGKAVYNLLFVQ